MTGITASNKTYDGTTAATLLTGGAGFTGRLGSDVLAVGSATGTFTDKNAGAGKTVTVSGITLGGADAQNYTLASNTATSTATIAQATISAVTGITAASKTYDGTTAATLSTAGAAFTGKVAGDQLTVGSATGSFADKNAATGKTVTISGITLGGTDALNYTLAGSTATTTADINKASISAVTGITAADKTYDGTTAATLVTGGAGFTGKVGGDALTVATATGAFADKNAGAGKAVAISGITLGGADALNYTLATPTAATFASINKATITSVGGITANDKTYDGATSATLVTGGATFAGKVVGDSLAVTSATGAFADKNAGAGKAVGISGIALTGADAGNYVLGSTTAATTATISKANATVTGNSSTVTYNGSTQSVSGFTASGLVNGETVAVLTGVSQAGGSGRNAGMYALTLAGSDPNYNLTFVPGALNIGKATLTLAASADTRTYNGGVASGGNVGISGLRGTDTASALQVFDSKNAGSRTLTPSLLAISDGNGGQNYTIVQQPATGSITPATLTLGNVTAQGKTYDGKTAATLAGTPALAGVVANDNVTLGNLSASFTDKNVGTANTVNASATLSCADAANYVLASLPPMTADITPALITVDGFRALDKAYDGTVFATLAGTVRLNGLVPGDDVRVAQLPEGNFTDRNAAANKPVLVTGLALAGADLSNYRLAPLPTVTATINPAPLEVRAGVIVKEQGTSYTFAGNEYVVTGLANGDHLARISLASTGAAATAAAGDYALVPSNAATEAGTLLSNYQVTYVPGTLIVSPASASVQQVLTQVISAIKANDPVTAANKPEETTVTKDGKLKKKETGEVTVTDTSCKPG